MYYFVEYEIDVSFYFFGFKLWPPSGSNPSSVPGEY